MSQTAYTQDPAAAVEGMLVDAGSPEDLILSRYLATDASIDFGLGVTHDAGGADDEVRAPVLTGEVTGGVFVGVTIADPTLEQAATPVGYVTGDMMRVLRRGRIWVICEDAAATIGLDAFVRFTSAGAERDGAFRTDADGGDAVALPGASFRTTTAAVDELIVLELNPTA